MFEVQKGKIELTNFENRNKPKTRPRGFSGHESPLLQAKLHNSEVALWFPNSFFHLVEPDLLKIVPKVSTLAQSQNCELLLNVEDDEEEEVGFELNIEEGTPQIIK